MKTLIKISTLLIAVLFGMTGCQDALETEPKGVLTENYVAQPGNVEGVLTAAYAFTGNARPCCWGTMTLNGWIPSVRSDDAYKGGGGLDDQTPWFQLETGTAVQASLGNNNEVWLNGYGGISLANDAIAKIQELEESEFPEKQVRLAEARFLRGWMHFQMKKRFKWIPFITEGLTVQEIKEIPNRRSDAPDDMYIWELILEDFKFASENLPVDQQDDGRVEKYAADAFIVKTLLWMAYPQDPNTHEVTGVDNQRLQEALQYTDEIINSGKYSLSSDVGINYLYAHDGDRPESIWEYRYSIEDGTGNGNLNFGNALTHPTFGSIGGSDFHKASYNMVNAFKVDENGLPMFETFNETSAQDNYNSYFSENTFDPRLSHTVAIPGLPWKYQQDNPFDSLASRQPAIYGYFHSMKENLQAGSPGLIRTWWQWDAKNTIEARYAEVLLWKAEILIELGRHNEALPIINQIRQRASQSTDMLTWTDGTPTLNYNVGLYQPGVNINWTQENAREALRWESRLELAMEGDRFFNLVRWGIAADVLNRYFEEEADRLNWFNDANFESGKHEYRPIPQDQMNLSEGVYTQNPGY
jgi:hypothetical protein